MFLDYTGKKLMGGGLFSPLENLQLLFKAHTYIGTHNNCSFRKRHHGSHSNGDLLQVAPL